MNSFDPLPFVASASLDKGTVIAPVAFDLAVSCLIDVAPPAFPATAADHTPLQIGAEKAELVGPRHAGVPAKTSVQPRQVLDATRTRQAAAGTYSNQVDQPRP